VGDSEVIPAKVVAERKVPGLGARYVEMLERREAGEDQPGEGAPPSDAEIASDLAAYADARGLTPEGARSGGGFFAWIADRLGRRVLVDDLGVHPVELDWLALHVPPGGTAAFELETTSRSASGVSLRILGLGYGSGREIELAFSRAFDGRPSCTRLTQVTDVRVRRYEIRGALGEIEMVTDVERLREQRVLPWPDCPHCGRRASDLSPIYYEVAPSGIDLRLDDVGASESETREIHSETKSDIKLPISIPGLSTALEAGVSMGVSASLRCSVTWHFPGRSFYRPYWDAEQVDLLPFWSVGS
jgi:hypothetical protein